jgi:hypothetical protein
MMLLRAYPRESQEMVFDARVRVLQGACALGVYPINPGPVERARRAGRF